MHVLKRYANRKLYSTIDKHYVTLPRLGELVRAGEEVQVVHHVTGADITAQTLVQVIAEEEQRSPRVPASVLERVIREGAATFSGKNAS